MTKWQKTAAALANYAVTRAAPAHAAPNAIPSPNPHLFARRSLPPEYAGKQIEKGSEGITRPPLELNEQAILDGCAFLGDAMREGGKDYDNALWNLTALAATFFKGGRAAAHTMSDKHDGYNPQDTDDLYDRKLREREKGLGWPSCNAIQRAGCGACAICPHLINAKSPFDLGKQKAQPRGAVLRDIYPGGYKPFLLPNGYAFDEAGRVCVVVNNKEEDTDGTVEYVPKLEPILQRQHILDPYVTESPNNVRFTIDGSVGQLREVSIEWSSLPSPQETARILVGQGVVPSEAGRPIIGKFLMSLKRRLEEAKKSITTKAFGWVNDEKGNYTGFAYGGKTFGADGAVGPGGLLGDVTKKHYTPVGDIDVWKAAAKFTTDQKRPELDVILASAFAAPLMAFTGQTIGVMSAYGGTSTGKTTTLRISTAVWSHPYDSQIPPDGTANQTQHKMGLLAHLPIVFDELGSSDDAMRGVYRLIWQEGKEKTRLKIDQTGHLTQRESGSWATIAVCTGNKSFAEFVNHEQPDTAAGRYRVFEFLVPHVARDGNAHWRIDPMLKKLSFNFGGIGLDYAQKLAVLGPTLSARLEKRGDAFGALVDERQAERFWAVICTCLLLGAELAVENGYAEFDLDLLEKYLVKTFLYQRQRLNSEGQEGQDAANELITAFLKDHFQAVLITDGVAKRGGPVGKKWFNIKKAPALLNQAKGVYLHFIADDNPRLRVSRLKLNEWLERHNKPLSMVYDRIPHKVTDRVSLGAGTPFAAGPERVMEIDAGPGTFLEHVLGDLQTSLNHQ